MIHNVDPQLSQWDVGRVVSISNSEATHIHFANQGDSKAVIIEITNGSAKIPDFLLHTGKSVIAYAVLNGVTLESKSFPVRKRERPENYVYEDDQRNYIYELIANAEDAVEIANQATASANTAAGSANLASTRANEAAASATDASDKATLATQNANEATERANEAATKANNAVKNMMVVGEAQGESISIDNAIDQTFVGLRVFGKTTQNGTPTPDAPVELVSVGDIGSITVNVNGENDAQSMTIATPNGLPGIPVTSGGNYTDANGQQWICDEIDFARGVFVKRVGGVVLNGGEAWSYQATALYFYLPILGRKPGTNLLCDRLPHARLLSTEVPGWWADDTSNNVFAVAGFVKAGIATTAESFKAYLAENPVNLLYILATPIETPLSEEELAAYASLHTYKDHTTVSNGASVHMELEYVMDAKKYIDSLVGTGGSIIPARVE